MDADDISEGIPSSSNSNIEQTAKTFQHQKRMDFFYPRTLSMSPADSDSDKANFYIPPIINPNLKSKRRNSQSQTFLAVPEERRISNVSGNSVHSCPTELLQLQKHQELNEESEETDQFHTRDPLVNFSPDVYRSMSRGLRGLEKYRISAVQNNRPPTNMPLLNSLVSAPISTPSSAKSDQESQCSSVRMGAPPIALRASNPFRKRFQRRASQPLISLERLSHCETCFLPISPHLGKFHYQRAQKIQCPTCETFGTDKIGTDRLNSLSGLEFENDQKQMLNKISIQHQPLIFQQNLRKRVSWLSMKSLLDPDSDSNQPIFDLNSVVPRKNRSNCVVNNTILTNVVNGFHKYSKENGSSSLLGSLMKVNSVSVLDDQQSYDVEADTPPIDTMSWSNLGN